MPDRYRKKPVEIEALQLTLDTIDEAANWVAETTRVSYLGPGSGGPALVIHTLEGDMRADLGDWIIRGVKGEFYPCKPDIFDATYQPASDAAHDHTVDARLVVRQRPEGGLEVDALALTANPNRVRYWWLDPVDNAGRWEHAPSGQSGPLPEMLGAITSVYRPAGGTTDA